jgi:pimeloyl-ACP methyl ester carboxylesterase
VFTRVIHAGAGALLGVGLLFPSGAPAAPPPEIAARAPLAAPMADGRRFLLRDPHGGGYAIEVVGDLAQADRTVVLVPGVAATLANFDRGLGGVARRAPAVQARAVLAEIHATDPAARVAVVAWLGYDPPDVVGLEAAQEDRARAGAVALIHFVARIAAERPATSITLVGHSYGAVVIGLAAPRLDRRVTDLVALGAPGMGVHQARDLHTQARVWAAEAPTDWIRRIPGVRVLGLGHGTRPGTPGFGARPLPTAGAAGHDGYLVPGSSTLHAVALVALGRVDDAATADAG